MSGLINMGCHSFRLKHAIHACMYILPSPAAHMSTMSKPLFGYSLKFGRLLDTICICLTGTSFLKQQILLECSIEHYTNIFVGITLKTERQ